MERARLHPRTDPPASSGPARSRCLGLVVLDVTNPFFTEVARGVEDYAQAAGYAVILCNSDEADDKERRYLRVLEEQRVRGILITPVHGRAPELRADPRAGHSRGAARPAGLGRASARSPSTTAAAARSRSATCSGSGTAASPWSTGRSRSASAPTGAAAPSGRWSGPGSIRQAFLPRSPWPAMNARAGAAAADELLGRGPRPTAVFCTNDMLALGLLRQQQGQAGVAVPVDLAVVGYDDIEFAADAAVPLHLGAPAQVPARPGRRRAPAGRGRPARPARAPPVRLQTRTGRAGQQRRVPGRDPSLPLRSRSSFVTGDPFHAAPARLRPYDVDAAFISLERHERGIHAL